MLRRALPRPSGPVALAAAPEQANPSGRGVAAPTRERAKSMDVEALYRRYGDLVLGRCRTLLRNDADAQEACQEVFLRVLRYQDSFRSESSPATWLFKVTTTTCLNRIRTRTRRREDLVEQSPAPGPEDTLLDPHELRDLLRHLMAEADELTGACVLYHCADGMTHEEVGALVGLSAAAVRKRIATFRTRLASTPPRWLKELGE